VISNGHQSRFGPTISRIRVIDFAVARKSARFGGFGTAVRNWWLVLTADPLRAGVISATFALVGTMLFQRPIGSIPVGGAELDVRPWDVAWFAFVIFALPLTIRHVGAEGLRALRPPTKTAAVFAVYAAAAALSLIAFFHEFGSAGFPEATIRAARFALVAYAGVVLAWELGSRAQTALIVAIVGVSVIAGAEALHAYAFGIKREIIGTRVVEYGVTRPGGPFGNFHSDGLPDRWWASPGASTTLGLWLGVAIALAGAAFLRQRPTADRLTVRMLALLSMPPLIVALALTGSREAWVGGLVVLFFLLVLYWRTRKILVLALILGAIGSVAFTVAVSPMMANRLVSTFTPGTFEFGTGPQARFDAWQEGLAIAWDRFPIGWGIGAVEEHSQVFGTPTSENLYIQSLVQMGAVGGLLIILLVVCGLWEPVRDLCLNSSNLWSVLRFSVIAVAATHGVFGYTLGDPTVQVLVALALVPPASRKGLNRSSNVVTQAGATRSRMRTLWSLGGRS
jgi:O-Antigen ligase